MTERDREINVLTRRCLSKHETFNGVIDLWVNIQADENGGVCARIGGNEFEDGSYPEFDLVNALLNGIDDHTNLRGEICVLAAHTIDRLCKTLQSYVGMYRRVDMDKYRIEKDEEVPV